MKFALAALLGAVSAEKLFDAEVNLADSSQKLCAIDGTTTPDKWCAEGTLCATSNKVAWVLIDGKVPLTLATVPYIAVCQPADADDKTKLKATDFTQDILNGGAAIATGTWKADSFVLFAGASTLAASAAATLAVAFAM